MSKEQEALDAANAALAELAEHITVRQTAIKAAERDEAAIIAERDAAEADGNKNSPLRLQFFVTRRGTPRLKSSGRSSYSRRYRLSAARS